MMTPATEPSEFQPSAAISTRGEIDVRALRKSLGLTRAEFAARFRIRLTVLKAYEARKRRPDATIRALLKAIGFSPSTAEEAVKKLTEKGGAWSSRFYSSDRFATSIMPIIRKIQASGITKPGSIAAALTARGVATMRGGKWTGDKVLRVLDRVREIEADE